MKKTTKQKPAFSLAEALITLLIISLITIASVPILTKKKRDISLMDHGKWICTRHSLGHEVSWTKGVSPGNEFEPDEWSPGCSFTPPPKARNFAVTVIGSGGGGASGISSIAKVADSNSTNLFSPSEDGLYKIAVIGGGGGGGGGINYNKYNNCGGGAGASGAVVVGDANLKKGQYYNLTAGGGGGARGAYLNGCVDGTDWGGAGGSSVFRSSGNESVVLIADGGNGGENISTGGYATFCKRHCYGGAAGSGKGWSQKGLTTLNYYRNGNNGASGGCNIYGTYRAGGGGFQFTSLGLPIAVSGVYGSGGNASIGNYNSYLQNGAGGYVAVFKITRKQGQGGGQAEPVMTTIPSIEGRVAVTIGNAPEPDVDGEVSKVEIFNKHNNRSRVVIGPAGKKGNAIETAYNTSGSNSVWTDNGGGFKGAVCTSNGREPIYDYVATGEVYTVCKNDTCEAQEAPPGFIEGDPSHNKEVASYVDPERSPASAYTQSKLSTIFTKIGISYFVATFPTEAGGVNYSVFTSSNILTYLQYNNEAFSSYKNYSSSYSSYPKMQNSGACFTDGKLIYKRVCEETEIVDKGENNKTLMGYIDSFKCPDAGNAVPGNFGAGGGGGYAHTAPGFAGKGGKGGPGAVIIEW